MKECRLCVEFRIARKIKHNEETSKTKYEALKEFGKNRPSKEVAIQFNVPGSTFATLRKNKEKIYQVFQNLSLQRQRVKVGTYEKIIWWLSEVVYINACQKHTYQYLVMMLNNLYGTWTIPIWNKLRISPLSLLFFLNCTIIAKDPIIQKINKFPNNPRIQITWVQLY